MENTKKTSEVTTYFVELQKSSVGKKLLELQKKCYEATESEPTGYGLLLSILISIVIFFVCGCVTNILWRELFIGLGFMILLLQPPCKTMIKCWIKKTEEFKKWKKEFKDVYQNAGETEKKLFNKIYIAHYYSLFGKRKVLETNFYPKR